MKKLFLSIFIFSLTINALFAATKDMSISSNISVAATSFSFEYNIDDTTQISIPVGMNILDADGTTIPPIYAGFLVEKAVNPYDINENSLQLKFGYGIAVVHNFNELYTNDFPATAIVPILSAQLEQHISKNHSIYLRTTPPLGALYYKNGIKFNIFEASSVFDYIRNFEAASLLTLSFGYRYTYD